MCYGYGSNTMHPIEPPDTHFLAAALGWLELGNPAEAKAELDQVSLLHQRHPDVLELRWGVSAAGNQWEEGLKAAQDLVRCAPDRASGWLHQAYALRRVPGGSVKRAWDALLPAFDLFPTEVIIPFNLSCYACQLGQHAVACDWLKIAMAVGGKAEITRMALRERDLEPIWAEIGKL